MARDPSVTNESDFDTRRVTARRFSFGCHASVHSPCQPEKLAIFATNTGIARNWPSRRRDLAPQRGVPAKERAPRAVSFVGSPRVMPLPMFEILPLCQALNVGFRLFREFQLMKRVDFLEVLGGAPIVTLAVELDCASHRISPTKTRIPKTSHHALFSESAIAGNLPYPHEGRCRLPSGWLI